MVRQRSAKPRFPSSSLGGASKKPRWNFPTGFLFPKQSVCFPPKQPILKEEIARSPVKVKKGDIMNDFSIKTAEAFEIIDSRGNPTVKARVTPVSYTHLDVYKRQLLYVLNLAIV